MSAPPAPRRLRRGPAGARPAAPVRLVHLGLGGFFRAHQAWYTEHAPDAGEWGYAAFTGRSPALAEALAAQDGCYSLVTRGPGGDAFEVVASISQARAAADHEAWLDAVSSPALAAVTVTVTEAGYHRRPDGGLDAGDDAVAADVADLRRDVAARVRTAPARLVAGLAARSRAGGGPIALVPCDNLPGNGAAVARVVRDLARLVDPGLAGALDALVVPVATVVDRITPRTTEADRRAIAEATGVDDPCAVVTEPFHEWLLAGSFPAGSPDWAAAGARAVERCAPYEARKLLLLNGAHSLLAYAGSLRGHRTTPAATADETCRGWLEAFWAEAAASVARRGLDEAAIAAYRAALLGRFANARLGDRLERIAEDGSEKLPVRVVPVLRDGRHGGRIPMGALRVVAAWICHLAGAGDGVPVHDVAAEALVPLAARALGGGPGRADAFARLLGALDPGLADDAGLLAALGDEAARLAAGARS